LEDVMVAALLMFELLIVTPPIELEAVDVPIKLKDVVVPALLMLVLSRVTPPIELEADDVPIKLVDVMVAALLMFELFRVTPPIELEAVDIPIKLEDVVVPALLMLVLDRVTPPIEFDVAAVPRIAPETSRATPGLLMPTPTPPDVILIARRLFVAGAVDAVAFDELLVKISIALLKLVSAGWWRDRMKCR
jgi:hypothetical protein